MKQISEENMMLHEKWFRYNRPKKLENHIKMSTTIVHKNMIWWIHKHVDKYIYENLYKYIDQLVQIYLNFKKSNPKYKCMMQINIKTYINNGFSINSTLYENRYKFDMFMEWKIVFDMYLNNGTTQFTKLHSCFSNFVANCWYYER